MYIRKMSAHLKCIAHSIYEEHVLGVTYNRTYKQHKYIVGKIKISYVMFNLNQSLL